MVESAVVVGSPTLTGVTDDAVRDEARRIQAVRAFQADQGRFPGILDALMEARRAEIAAEDLESARYREPVAADG